MRTLIVACVIAVGPFLGGFGVDAEQSPRSDASKIDVSKLGPQVGERVPDFSLRDQTGRTQTLQSIVGPKGAMLVFVRSADW
ncbi:MAG: hypothetical protein LC791_20230 [Acidobacteria bacterium]|nr:hypothetical protein [Acidobacteriota bacterium]